jgi:flagellar basal-body rod protein FlgC
MSDSINILPSLRISSSGLDAESRRMETIANNIANANSTAKPGEQVYRPKRVVFAAHLAEAMGQSGQGKREFEGVQVKGVVDDPRPDKLVYRPGHPDADKDGYVRMPDINIVEEMVDMMSASRAYEANLAAVRTARTMATQALGIGK